LLRPRVQKNVEVVVTVVEVTVVTVEELVTVVVTVAEVMMVMIYGDHEGLCGHHVVKG